MNVCLPRRTHSSNWPTLLSVSFWPGVIFVFIVVATDRLWTYSRVFLRPHITSDTVLDWIIEIGIVSLNTVIVCSAVQYITKVPIQKILGFKNPDFRDMLKWGYVVFAVSSYNLILEIPAGFGPQYESELWFLFIRLLRSVLLIPIYEEIVYRFLVYGALRTRFNKWVAMLVSSTIFVIVHQIIHKALGIPNLTVVILFIMLFSFGLLAAYLYETRRTLLLCIVIHAVVNLTYWSAHLIGYLAAGTIAQGEPLAL